MMETAKGFRRLKVFKPCPLSELHDADAAQDDPRRCLLPPAHGPQYKRSLGPTFSAGRGSAMVQPESHGLDTSGTELLPKPKPEPVRRVEMFTGSGRPRLDRGAEGADRRRDL